MNPTGCGAPKPERSGKTRSLEGGLFELGWDGLGWLSWDGLIFFLFLFEFNYYMYIYIYTLF